MHPALSACRFTREGLRCQRDESFNNRLILTRYEGVCHEYTLDDSFWLLSSPLKRSSDEVNEPNRTDGCKSTYISHTDERYGDFHWHWPLKHPETIKVSLACFSSPLWLSSCHHS